MLTTQRSAALTSTENQITLPRPLKIALAYESTSMQWRLSAPDGHHCNDEGTDPKRSRALVGQAWRPCPSRSITLDIGRPLTLNQL
jgi:hypothetical protein